MGPNPLDIGVLIGVTAQMLKRFLEFFERRAFVLDAERRLGADALEMLKVGVVTQIFQ